ncbi:MAG TPA: right-handed parallel beta-helix repeat-containing protein [Phycisphaerae bacterium]|nr:right-handed parallel beta-helix repeat-containing protein [Phycisphaerae bacterium]HRY71277.1 right-handed parallel beta-helix repeat-containing protein [Phycisphaerae bacterium]HSA29631.1 right-handed parallel beta-helix repeat-containing protein [Phycisphaerae bacterium]
MAFAPCYAIAPFALLVASSPTTTRAGTIFYVNAAASGANTGLSWTDAFTDLEAAIEAAAATGGGSSEIWVAAGTYRPSERTDLDDPRSATFQLRSGVAICGGFLGGERLFEARNPDANVVVLSGDLHGNDEPEPDPFDQTRLDNAYNVVTCSGAYRTAVLDGVIISDGHASLFGYDEPVGISRRNSGAGMFSESASPTIRDCTFRRNSTRSYRPTQGGGMLNLNSNPYLVNCTFEENSVYGENTFSGGGGMCNIGSRPTLIDCVFRANTADGYDSEHYGGAIENRDSSATLTRCLFIENRSHRGGAVSEAGTSCSTLTDCTFIGNWSHNVGGAMNIESANCPMLTRCRFHGNSSQSGGGVHCDRGAPTLHECSFIGNDADWGGGMRIWGSPTLVACSFAGNTAGQGGAICNEYKSSPRLTGCRFDANSSGCGGALYNNSTSAPLLMNCAIVGNSAWLEEPWYGGGGVFNDGASPAFAGCLFAGNSAAGRGGGMRNYGWSTGQCQVNLTNCTFAGNSAAEGDTLACSSENRAFPGPTTIRNCILWDSEDGITADDGSTITTTYSDVRGGWPGNGNIDADPLFIDANEPDGIGGTADDRLRLSADSPCIDAGNNSAAPAGLTADLDGRARFVDIPEVADTGAGTPPIVDMGAYERFVSARADLDADGDVDLDDLSMFQVCLSGPAVPVWDAGCRSSDFDGDWDVDQSDFGIFQRCWSGSNVPADPNCAN